MPDVRIRLACQDERQRLERLQRRASLEVDDYRQDLLAHPDAIELPAEHFERGEVLVAEIGHRLVGFAVVLDDEAGAELDGLFVEPALWRQGIGSALVAEAVHNARRRGLSLMTVVAAPSAKVFYERCGFAVEGEVATRFGPAVRMSR